jgi:hypothetical protein
MSPQRVNALRLPSQITSEIALTVSVSGTITKRDVNAGEVVEANNELMRVTNFAVITTLVLLGQVLELTLHKINTLHKNRRFCTKIHSDLVFIGIQLNRKKDYGKIINRIPRNKDRIYSSFWGGDLKENAILYRAPR